MQAFNTKVSVRATRSSQGACVFTAGVPLMAPVSESMVSAGGRLGSAMKEWSDSCPVMRIGANSSIGIPRVSPSGAGSNVS